jgi:small subunit ribosomal protein S7
MGKQIQNCLEFRIWNFYGVVMPRGKYRVRKPPLAPDPVRHSILVHKLINYLMRRGKKETASDIVYQTLESIEQKMGKEPLEILETAVKNASPMLEVRARRIGGANYQIPTEVRPERKIMLALRWIVEAARGKQGRPMKEFLAQEIIDAFKGEGTAIRKRDEMHRMAEANRAFAHFTRF